MMPGKCDFVKLAGQRRNESCRKANDAFIIAREDKTIYMKYISCYPFLSFLSHPFGRRTPSHGARKCLQGTLMCHKVSILERPEGSQGKGPGEEDERVRVCNPALYVHSLEIFRVFFPDLSVCKLRVMLFKRHFEIDFAPRRKWALGLFWLAKLRSRNLEFLVARSSFFFLPFYFLSVRKSKSQKRRLQRRFLSLWNGSPGFSWRGAVWCDAPCSLYQWM